VGGSGVMTDSLGVERAEGPVLFAFAVRPKNSPSGFVADLITFWLGRVPRGAMF
jgi:hypothetical protein